MSRTSGAVPVSGGWVSYASIVLRFLLTVAAALVLTATTGFIGVCLALEKLKVPEALVTQLLLLYRYIFVLGDEAHRMSQARRLRSFRRRGMGWRVYAQMLGQLLLRTFARAQRVYLAMKCRGFDGEIRVGRPLHFGAADLAFVLRWSAAFMAFRAVDVPLALGHLVTAASCDGSGAMSHHTISVRDLSFAYPDGTQALDGVSFEMGHGEAIASSAPTAPASRRSSCTSTGCSRPTTGSIDIGGIPVTKGTLAEIRRTVGMVFQDPDDQLFMPTVAEDVGFGPLNLGLPPADVAARVDCRARARRRRRTWQERPPYRLSGGEKRAVAIATVLAMEPSILVMDEPSSGPGPSRASPAHRPAPDLRAHTHHRDPRPGPRGATLRAHHRDGRRPRARRPADRRRVPRRRAARDRRPRAAARHARLPGLRRRRGRRGRRRLRHAGRRPQK